MYFVNKQQVDEKNAFCSICVLINLFKLVSEQVLSS